MPSKYEWDQLYKKMANAQDYLDFIRKIAEWDREMWGSYDRLLNFSDEAQSILRQP